MFSPSLSKYEQSMPIQLWNDRLFGSLSVKYKNNFRNIVDILKTKLITFLIHHKFMSIVSILIRYT